MRGLPPSSAKPPRIQTDRPPTSYRCRFNTVNSAIRNASFAALLPLCAPSRCVGEVRKSFVSAKVATLPARRLILRGRECPPPGARFTALWLRIRRSNWRGAGSDTNEFVRHTGVGLFESASSVRKRKLQNAVVACGLSRPLPDLYLIWHFLPGDCALVSEGGW